MLGGQALFFSNRKQLGDCARKSERGANGHDPPKSRDKGFVDRATDQLLLPRFERLKAELKSRSATLAFEDVVLDTPQQQGDFESEHQPIGILPRK